MQSYTGKIKDEDVKKISQYLKKINAK